MARQERTPDQEGEEKPGRRNLTLAGLGVAAVLLAWFAVANSRTVTIDFWVRDSRAPLIVVIAISGLLGALISALARRRRSHQD
jgi:uncharacterized integral membrane protein